MSFLSRRELILAASGAALAGPVLAQTPFNPVELERQIGGRLGVFAQTTTGRMLLSHRASERFPMASTFKASLAAAVLQRVDRGEEQLERRVPFRIVDLVSHSPALQAAMPTGFLTVAELCAAIVQVSDNGAANLLLATIGGPAGLTRFWRSLGDRVTRLDRTEPELNEATPGDPRDTTSPAAMTASFRAFQFGPSLSPRSKAQMRTWLQGTTTGLQRIRGGLPAGWPAGDKTGTGSRGTVNDVAVIWPPGRSPVIVSVYTHEGTGTTEQKSAVHAAVGRRVAELVRR